MLPSLLLLAQLGLLAASSGEEGPCSPGEDPASCDASAADVLLQKGRAKKHSGADDLDLDWDGREWPGTVHWDGFQKLRLMREEMASFVAEVYYKIPESAFGARNQTHVFIEFNRMIKGIFIRDFHGVGSHEYGQVTWVVRRNPVSIVAMNVSVGIGEKLHTWAHRGPWRRDSLRRVRQIQRGRWTWENELAKAQVIPRSLAVTSWNFMGQVGLNLVNASKDMNIFRDVQEVAAEGNTAYFEQRMQAAGGRLDQNHTEHLGSLNGRLPESSSTALNCFHFSEVPGIHLTSEGAWMPLDTLIPATRGQLVLTPIQRFDLMSGNSMIKYNAGDRTYGVYMGAAQHSNVVDPYVGSGTDRHEPKLFVGPADGQQRAIPPEGRLRVMALNFAQKSALWALHQAWFNTHADYTFLWDPPSQACPPHKLREVRRQIQEYRIEAISDFSLWAAAGVLTLVVNAMPCSIDYLRSDIPNSHSFGPFESFGYLHAMVEFPDVIIMQGWNDVDEGLFCPAGGCTTTTTTRTTTTTTTTAWWGNWGWR